MIEYSPPYERLVCDYKKANMGSIQKAIEQINRRFLFSNKSAHHQVKILDNTLMNVFSNFIPKKLVTFNDKDPPWMSEYLRNKKLNGVTKYMQSISMKIMRVLITLRCRM